MSHCDTVTETTAKTEDYAEKVAVDLAEKILGDLARRLEVDIIGGRLIGGPFSTLESKLTTLCSAFEQKFKETYPSSDIRDYAPKRMAETNWQSKPLSERATYIASFAYNLCEAFDIKQALNAVGRR